MWTSIKDAAKKKPCDCEDDDKVKVESTSQTAGGSESKLWVVSFEDNRSSQTSQSSETQSGENINVNAGVGQCSDPNVGSKHLHKLARKKSKEQETETDKNIGIVESTVLHDKEDKEDKEEVKCCRCKPPDPWKRPPDMEQQTFERYMQEIVCTLRPAIPPNPFAVPREPCVNIEPNCESIRLELERLLAAVDECPATSTPPCPCTPTAVRSGCRHC